MTPGERYEEQARAWDAEKARRAARPWWKKLGGAFDDWNDRYAFWVFVGTLVTLVSFFVTVIGLLIHFLSR